MTEQMQKEDLIVLYEDNHVIVVLKPQNVPSCEDETKDKDMLTRHKGAYKGKGEQAGQRICGACSQARSSYRRSYGIRKEFKGGGKAFRADENGRFREEIRRCFNGNAEGKGRNAYQLPQEKPDKQHGLRLSARHGRREVRRTRI